jgi:hypothetical protein
LKQILQEGGYLVPLKKDRAALFDQSTANNPDMAEDVEEADE